MNSSKYISGIACLFTVTVVFASVTDRAAGQSSDSARRFEQIEEVVAGFDSAQHLYVQGEIGIGPQQLAELETWLKGRAPHWTIVLMQRGTGQVYAAPDGRTFAGMDAVEYALGHGLANRTEFGRLEHPKTGETDGAAFVLFLEDRKFSYYASDAQDRRGIGESRWIGDLDREARSAMQNGGRIIDAVKNTVTSIDGRLSNILAQEQQAAAEQAELARRAQAERQRAYANTLGRIEETRTKLLPEFEAIVANFLKNNPEAAASPMAKPNVSKWTSELDDAEIKLNEDNSRKLLQDVEGTINDIHRNLDIYGAHQAFEQTIAPIQKRWELQTLQPMAASAEIFNQRAQRLLREAREKHLRGDPGFIEALQQATKRIDEGDVAIATAIQQAEANAARRRLIRNTLLAGTAFGTIVVISGLVFLNRRRKQTMLAALKSFSKYRDIINQEQCLMDIVLTRKRTLVGTLEQFSERGVTGQTLLLGTSIIKDTETLQRMAAESQRVMWTAESFLSPTDLLSKAINLISKTRYLECRNVLSGKSLTPIDTTDSTSLGTSEKDQASQETSRLPLDSKLTFEEFYREVTQVRQSAMTRLDRLEKATIDVKSWLERLEKKYALMSERQHTVEDKAVQDGYFSMVHLKLELLPSIRKLINRCTKLASIDPVQVVSTLGPEVERQVLDTTSLMDRVVAIRENEFSVFDDAGDQLRSLKHRVRWIEDEVVAFCDTTDQISNQISKKDCGDMLRKFDADVAAFVEKVRRIIELAKTIPTKQAEAMSRIGAKIVAARVKVASTLSIPASSAIHEEGLNPDSNMQSAESALKAASVAIDMGNLVGANDALLAAESERRHAESLIEESLTTLAVFSDSHSVLTKHLLTTQGSAQTVFKQVQAAEKTYAKDAMRLRAHADKDLGDRVEGSVEASASTEIAMAQVEIANKSLEEIQASLEAAPAEHQSGKLLTAAARLKFSQERLTETDSRLLQAANHCRTLDALVPRNSNDADMLLADLDGHQSEFIDRRIEHPTLVRIHEIRTGVEELSQSLKRQQLGRDPFSESALVSQWRMSTTELYTMIKADFVAHEHAARAVAGASNELRSVRRLVQKSQHDQVPDSAAITQCQEQSEPFEAIVSSLEGKLAAAHGDWQALHTEAADATAQLGVIAGTLSRELQAAGRAGTGLRYASAEVVRASKWNGRYGITVNGSPGSDHLEAARHSLSNGDYQSTIYYCDAVVEQVAKAIQDAEQAVVERDREIREEQEREKERRRIERIRVRNESRSSSGGFSFGSSSSSSHSWSSGSSFSSSSSSSSSSGGSSGFSRSGW